MTQGPQKVSDELIERACCQHAWETNRAFLHGVTGRDHDNATAGDPLPWGLIPEEQRRSLLKLVKFILAGGTAEANWELFRQKPENEGKALPPWEKVPWTQRAKEELVVASVNALAMTLGHSKRPLEVHTVVQGPGAR